MLLTKKIQNEKIRTFLNKLGERLALERTCSRLYQTLMGRVKMIASSRAVPLLQEVEKQMALTQSRRNPTLITQLARVRLQKYRQGPRYFYGLPWNLFRSPLHYLRGWPLRFVRRYVIKHKFSFSRKPQGKQVFCHNLSKTTPPSASFA
jgi:hypothetical protein